MPVCPHRRLCLLLLLGWLGFFPAGIASAQAPSLEVPANVAAEGDVLNESWAIIYLKGLRVGFANSVVSERDTPEGKQYVTRLYEQLALKRMGSTLKMVNKSVITEDAEGLIVNFESVNESFGANKTVRGFRVGDEMVVLSGSVRRTHPFPFDAKGPFATEQAFRGTPLEPGATKTVSTFMPDSPAKAVEQTYTVIGETQQSIEGERQRLWEVSAAISILPGINMQVYLDNSYEVQMMKMPLPLIGTLEIVTADRDKAMERIEAAEVFANTLIQPDRPLPNYRQLKRARFALRTDPPNQEMTLYEGEGQRVIERRDDGTVVVETTVPVLQPRDASYNLPASATPELANYLRESAYLERNAQIEELARQAVGQEKNPLKAARQIDRFVRRYIERKNLGVGFASAAETAANRQGDCTEHAVLCAALGRAVGLPTRVVSGFGYLPTDYAGSGDPSLGTFGFHMWAEAYLAPGKWVPMDAALGEFTVCHIAIDKSDLDETNPFIELSVPILELLQNLQIKVLETE
ncbi:MAG: transglutaminase-like domain-containing protein [Verrucomicrobiota bacterium]